MIDTTTTPSTHLTASCHCRRINFTLTLPTSTLPLNVTICHCDTCRTSTGAPCTFYAPLPLGVQPLFIAPSSFDSLTGYTHARAHGDRSIEDRGENERTVTRFFCSRCGCHIGYRGMKDTGAWRWYISVSIFEEGSAAAWKFVGNAFADKTVDGGFSEFFNGMHKRQLQVRDQPIQESQEERDARREEVEAEAELIEEEYQLLAKCHCGELSLSISRPRADYMTKPESGHSVHYSNTHLPRWLALVDLCSDCRLVTGTHLTTWLFVQRDHISPSIPESLLIGTARSYWSSDNVLRTFCGTCGATVFVTQAQQGDVVDIATGLLRAREGVMLGHWAWWRGLDGSFLGDGLKYDEVFARALKVGFEAWRVREYGEGVKDTPFTNSIR
ncbi:hypothetical protein BJY04DRAFT_219708 [Aspergillus karnatakaensis]|uniref:GFA family protein n=1 Tax=Aspergillus karnatakaensis TaxID=1810916 RepID=UPI003CCCEFCC